MRINFNFIITNTFSARVCALFVVRSPLRSRIYLLPIGIAKLGNINCLFRLVSSIWATVAAAEVNNNFYLHANVDNSNGRESTYELISQTVISSFALSFQLFAQIYGRAGQSRVVT